MTKETAMKILKELHDNSLFSNRIALETLIPELAYDNDERIRKDIIAYIKKANGEPNNVLPSGSYCVLEMITWLEKQGTQKPTSDIKYKVSASGSLSIVNEKPFDYEKATITQKDFAPKQEPKFKVGDWIITKDKNVHKDYSVCKIVEIENNRYHLENGDYLGIDTLEQYDYYLWTIQDAKDGDVLISQYGKPFIYNGNYNSFNIGAYCGITCDDNFKVAEEKCHWTDNVDIKPSTKEQRDLLFAKMKEAGYEWDAEKKELKKIDARENLTLDGDLMQADCMMVEPKQEWSEEDEEMAEDLIKGCVSAEKAHHFLHTPKEVSEWLKSIKDRIGG